MVFDGRCLTGPSRKKKDAMKRLVNRFASSEHSEPEQIPDAVASVR
jgi:hypothetical protein